MASTLDARERSDPTVGDVRGAISRRSFVQRLSVACGALPFVQRANQSKGRVHRIGLAIGEDPEGGEAAFKAVLRERGYVEGQNLVIEKRETLRAPAGTNGPAELARMDLDLLVVHTLPSALAARVANPAMRLVIITTPGLITNGFAQSVEHPGGNATGIDELPPGVTARRLELLKTAAPSVSRVALLSTTPGHGGHETQLADAETAARTLGVEVNAYRATTLTELREALAAIAADRMDGLVNFQGGLSYVNRQLIVESAAHQRIPAIYQATVFAKAGGLMTWAPDLVDQFRIAADYVDQILKGARAGDLPIRYPPRYFLTLNNAAAHNLGLTFPPALLAQADRVLAGG